MRSRISEANLATRRKSKPITTGHSLGSAADGTSRVGSFPPLVTRPAVSFRESIALDLAAAADPKAPVFPGRQH